MHAEFAAELPQGWDHYDRFFSALGDPTRQKILLIFESNEEVCVGDIAKLFQLSRPAISHHLKVLKNARLVSCEKRGKEIYYRLNNDHIQSVLDQVYDRLGHVPAS